MLDILLRPNLRLSDKIAVKLVTGFIFALSTMTANAQMLQNVSEKTCIYGDCENGRGTVELKTPFGMAVYRGEFKDRQFHGLGRLEEPISFTSDALYDGNWDMGYRSGKGKYWDGNGNLYIGDWLQDKRHGQGTYVFGYHDWKENQHSPLWLMENTENYTGEFFNDLYQGQGTYRWPNGSKYTGGFFANDKHGQGTFYYETGTRRLQTWNYGDLIN